MSLVRSSWEGGPDPNPHSRFQCVHLWYAWHGPTWDLLDLKPFNLGSLKMFFFGVIGQNQSGRKALWPFHIEQSNVLFSCTVGMNQPTRSCLDTTTEQPGGTQQHSNNQRNQILSEPPTQVCNEFCFCFVPVFFLPMALWLLSLFFLLAFSFSFFS